MIHRFPSKSTAHSQKTFVSNLTRKRRITNKSPFKDVYPLINADSLMTNICNVVREIFAIIVSVMVIQTQNFINLTRTLRFWQCCKTETSWFKILNHDDDEEKTDRKANMCAPTEFFSFFLLFNCYLFWLYCFHFATCKSSANLSFGRIKVGVFQMLFSDGTAGSSWYTVTLRLFESVFTQF